MAIFTPSDVRSYLEGFIAASTSSISDTWIQDEIDNTVIPFAENFCRTSFSAVQTVSEIYSGNGTSLIILNRKNITAVLAIQLIRDTNYVSYISPAAVEVLAAEGILKARTNYNEGIYCTLWPKGNDNIKIQYTYGGTCPNDVKKALIKLTAILVLGLIEGRTGGGDLSVQGFARSYGKMGKYTNVIMKIYRQAMSTLKRYSTSVSGA